MGPPVPHPRRDWAHPCHICAGTGLAPAHICAGIGLAQGCHCALQAETRDILQRDAEDDEKLAQVSGTSRTAVFVLHAIMQRATRNHATRNMQRVSPQTYTCLVCRAACSSQHTASSLQHEAWHGACSARRADRKRRACLRGQQRHRAIGMHRRAQRPRKALPRGVTETGPLLPRGWIVCSDVRTAGRIGSVAASGVATSGVAASGVAWCLRQPAVSHLSRTDGAAFRPAARRGSCSRSRGKCCRRCPSRRRSCAST